MTIKQVIVVRKDLKMRRGKENAQTSHASSAWLAKRLDLVENKGEDEVIYDCILTRTEAEWLNGQHTKITLQVDSEKALVEVYQAAKQAGLEVHLITDAGKTEFNGVPTKTCLAIGPDHEEKIDPITKALKLY